MTKATKKLSASRRANFRLVVVALGVFLAFGFAAGAQAQMLGSDGQSVVTNDPGFTLENLNIDKQWGLVAANFPKAWTKTTGASSTVVAIIDTGVDELHEDLVQGHYVEGYDLVNDQKILPGTDSDDNGHGTLVAGVLASVANNRLGVAGGVWQVNIMPVKALDSAGKGDSSTVSKAIIWAADHGAQIINLSMGGSGFDHDAELSKAVSHAFNQGALIIAAAGNDDEAGAKDLDIKPVFPVCNDNNQNMVIGVSSVDQNLIKPDFANYGKNCIDVVAPGRRILSTINLDPLTKRATESGYAYVSGTSLSTAFVSAQAALIKSLYPYASNKQIRERIINTAKSVDNLNQGQCGKQSCQGRLGAGLIDVAASINNNFPLPTLLEGDVVRAEGGGQVFLISGGQKRAISPFVYNQRFLDIPIKIVPQEQLDRLQAGSYATPQEGTLIKILNDPTVYIIQAGLKLPITGQIFAHYSFDYNNVKIVDVVEASSWSTGKFLAPKEGTLVKTAKSKALYWTAGGALHYINYEFYKDRGLAIFPVLTVTTNDFLSYNIGEAYIR